MIDFKIVTDVKENNANTIVEAALKASDSGLYLTLNGIEVLFLDRYSGRTYAQTLSDYRVMELRESGINIEDNELSIT